MPTISDIIDVHNELCASGDLREPTALEEQLLHPDNAMESEVGLAMLQMLKVGCLILSVAPCCFAAEIEPVGCDWVQKMAFSCSICVDTLLAPI